MLIRKNRREKREINRLQRRGVKERAGMGFPTDFQKHLFPSQHSQIGKSAAHNAAAFFGTGFCDSAHNSFLSEALEDAIRFSADEGQTGSALFHRG